ncbi:serine protease [Bacillus solimangrovi]|uniref:serine protease n=1 Tax=Bacillus solimangrovi TaxID=1305675 RepID=UPI001112F1BA|nr:serine protease [Bacillus solimangrovi]
MNKAQQIKEEIHALASKIDELKSDLKDMQQQCEHHFTGDLAYQRCEKCHYVEVMHY